MATTELFMQGDGNLVEYVGGRALWASDTAGDPGGYLAMQGDGNLVLYSAANQPLWSRERPPLVTPAPASPCSQMPTSSSTPRLTQRSGPTQSATRPSAPARL